MKYANRIKDGVKYVSSSEMHLNDEDLVMEWYRTLESDYRYIQLTPGKRRNYLLKRIIYDGIKDKYPSKPSNIRIALAFSEYLNRKELFLEDNILAGAYQFSDHIYTHPFDEQDELDTVLEDSHNYDIHVDSDAFSIFLNYVQCGFCTKNPSGHVIPNYENLLKIGYGGILSKITEQLKQFPDDSFLESAYISIIAAQNYFIRYSVFAQESADLTEKVEDKECLLRMSNACKKLSNDPPETFFEAVQLIALTHEIAISEQLSGSISFGRFDAYITPYYFSDLDKGIIDSEEAYRIIYSFFSKIGRNRLAYQNMTIGGLNLDGEGYLPTVITKMCLRASRELHKDEPMLTFRWNDDMPNDLWDDVLCSIESGTGFPALFNEHAVISAKQNAGLSLSDAKNFGIIGCVEICAPGKEFSHAEGLRINWAKILEIALNNGIDTLTGITFPQANPRSLSSFSSYEEFYNWFINEFLFTLDQMLNVIDICEKYYPNRWPLPFMSSLMSGCIESRKDVTAGGTIYNNTAINNSSMADLADSLQVIRKFVFEQKKYSLEDFQQMITANFDGYELDRAIIQKGIDHYGNGHTDSENIIKDISTQIFNHLIPRRNSRGGKYTLGFYSVWAQATFGQLTGALPDGRYKQTPLANSMAPVQGCEKNGPTAVSISATVPDHSLFGNGMVLDYKFTPSFFKTEAHRKSFRNLVEGYFLRGGMEMQFNVVDQETLRDAQIHPELYPDLIVRVSGYSAFFTDLSPDIQNEIILRTSFN